MRSARPSLAAWIRMSHSMRNAVKSRSSPTLRSDSGCTDDRVEGSPSQNDKFRSRWVRRAYVLHSNTHVMRVPREESRMNVRMLVTALSLAVLTACSPRQVDVRTAPVTQAQVSVQVNNTLSQ